MHNQAFIKQIYKISQQYGVQKWEHNLTAASDRLNIYHDHYNACNAYKKFGGKMVLEPKVPSGFKPIDLHAT